ncbi:MAG: CRISPR-associated endonuclease Cas3'', partial [Bacteroidota bacterium]|nr:CRISPR-associated endonuclease Cas3'' [Bacteroidota bacterium]
MKFYSHAKESNGVKLGSKLLINHLTGVSRNAISNSTDIVNFDLSQDEIIQIIEEITKFHDLGKYTSFFQNYLLGKNTDSELKKHSRIGAFAILNKNISNPILALWQYFIIINHHSSFDDIISNLEMSSK